MQRRTRNRICIWLIFAGLLNFVVYTVVYAELGGDAKNGGYRYDTDEQEQPRKTYYIMGHFIHGPDGRERTVSRSVWIYSYLHSISLWPTQAMIVICLMILARPHIIATMQESNLIRGPAVIVAIITVTTLLCAVMTAVFTADFLRALSA